MLKRLGSTLAAATLAAGAALMAFPGTAFAVPITRYTCATIQYNGSLLGEVCSKSTVDGVAPYTSVKNAVTGKEYYCQDLRETLPGVGGINIAIYGRGCFAVN